MRALVSLLVFFAVAGLTSLFFIQNSLRTVVLSLNLGPLGAWTVNQAIPVPVALAASFALGAVLVAIPALVGSYRKSSRIRELERQLAASGF